MSWKLSKLKDSYLKFIDGDRSSKYPKKSEFKKDGVIFLNAGSISGGRFDISSVNYISQDKYDSISKGRVEPNDVIITTRGNGVGQCFFYNGEYGNALINAQMLIIRADLENIHSKFIYYSFISESCQRSFLNYSSGSAQPQLPISSLKEIEIVFPPLETQKRIASILSTYDDLIENNLKRIKLLEETAQNIYKEWFVNFRFPNYEHTEFDAESGLPVGWKKSKLKNHFPILTGKKDANHSSENGLFPFFTCGKESLLSNDYAFDCDAILLAGNGEFNVKYYRGKFQAYQRTYVLSPQNKKELFLIYINLKLNLLKLTSGSKGSVIKFLTKGMIEEFSFILPNSDLLTLFHNNVNLIYLQVENLTIQNQKLKEARDILLPRLMNRTIEV